MRANQGDAEGEPSGAAETPILNLNRFLPSCLRVVKPAAPSDNTNQAEEPTHDRTIH